MTTLADRPRTALLVVDVQRDVVDGAHDRDGVGGRIRDLVARAREGGVPVVWVQHSDDGLPEGSDGWRYVPELQRTAGEPLVAKHHGDSFEGTDLEQILADARVGRLVVAGAETDACIRSTIHGGFARGYDVTLVADAHTAGDKTGWGAPPRAGRRRAHQPVLALPDGAGPHGRGRRRGRRRARGARGGAGVTSAPGEERGRPLVDN